MKSIEFYIYYFTHKIDLREYLEKVYSMSFKPVNSQYQSQNDPDLIIDPDSNTWIHKNTLKDKKSPKGVFLGAGNILDWESIKNNITIAETTPIILKNVRTLSSYDSNEFKRLQRLYRLVNTRIKHNSDTDVENYLKNRGIDVSLIKNDFNLGILSNYGRLYNSMPANNRNNLSDVFILQRKADRCLKPDKGIAVPIIYDPLDQVGYHGRYITDIQKPYFNSGYVRDIVSEILFGEDNQNIQVAIKNKRQLLLCKGIIDQFAAYQNGEQQVLSTLNRSVSIKQFNKIKKYNVDEIIIGYHVDKYQARFASLMQLHKLTAHIKHLYDEKDLDEQLLNPSVSASKILSQAIHKFQVDKINQRKAKVDIRNDIMSELRVRGYTFLIKVSDIVKEINSTKNKTQLRNFIIKHRKNNIKLFPKGTHYVEFPGYGNTAILNSFGTEIRTLLFLLVVSIKTGKIGYRNKVLANALDIGESTLREHKRILIKNRYLIKEDIRKGKGKTRKDHTDFYPSTLPYGS